MLYWAITLSKAGYGDVNLLLSYSSDIFMNILQHESFLVDYAEEARALNTEG